MNFREQADDTRRKINEKLQTLRRMKTACVREKRIPTSEEEARAKKLLDEYDELSKRQKELKSKVPTKTKEPVDDRSPEEHAAALAEGRAHIFMDSESHSLDRQASPYEIKTSADKKDYRSLYGENGGAHTWRDNQSNFFEALFSGRYHPDLDKRAMNEGTPSDGGFLVPVEYAEKIHNVSLENELVMPRATVMPMQSNSLMLPAVDIGDHSSNLYGGFTASYKAEAATLAEANPKTRQMNLQAKKLTGFLRFSNELMADAQNGERQILDICGKGLSWYRDKSFLKGTGAGEPLGILNADCTLAQAKESGQSADTIVYENLVGMLGKLHPASFKNAVWVCHQSTIPQLLQISIAIGTGGSFVPVLSETDGQFTILTRPVIFTEKTEVLGDKGDILLCDFSQYIIGLRSEMRIDLSQHLYFSSDEGAARLIERHDAQPLWNEALTLEDGSTEVSPFVTLAART